MSFKDYATAVKGSAAAVRELMNSLAESETSRREDVNALSSSPTIAAVISL